jgi:hypothetical protein
MTRVEFQCEKGHWQAGPTSLTKCLLVKCQAPLKRVGAGSKSTTKKG